MQMELLSFSNQPLRDVRKNLEYGKPASRRFPRVFSFTISGRRTKRGLVEIPVKDISLLSGDEEGRKRSSSESS